MKDFYLHLNIGKTFVDDSSKYNLGEIPFVRIDETFDQCDAAYALCLFLYDRHQPYTDEEYDAVDAEMQQVIDTALDHFRRGITSGTFAVNGVDYFFLVEQDF